jgi:hypothetical protein
MYMGKQNVIYSIDFLLLQRIDKNGNGGTRTGIHDDRIGTVYKQPTADKISKSFQRLVKIY